MSGNRWGQAKREVTALKPLIVQRLESGSTVRQIWLELHGDGQVSVTLKNFYTQVGKLLQPQFAHTKPATGQSGGGLALFRPKQSPRSEIVSTPPAVPSSSEDDLNRPFAHNKRPREGDLWGTDNGNGSEEHAD